MQATPQTLTLIQPDDWHLHLRDGEALRVVLPLSAAQMGRAIVMPNLKPPVTTTALALAYKARIEAALKETSPGSSFTPLMTLYLTDNTSADEIKRAHDSGVVKAVKLYPAGATTNSDAGVTSMRAVSKALDAMQACGMPLLVHGEVVDASVDIFDREAVFIERELIPLRRSFPALKIVLEHATTEDAVSYVQQSESGIGCTITAHHLLYNRNAIFTGGLRPHFYCLPVLKREKHRLALLNAATSGHERFFLGTDSAPHASQYKERSAVCAAGCFTAHAAIEMYAEAFEAMNALDKLEAFASLNGAAFYGLKPNVKRITLKRESWDTPERYASSADGFSVVPLRGGESMPWKCVGIEA
jgi:dihydroorotase